VPISEEGRLMTELAIVRAMLSASEVIDDPPTYRHYVARERALQVALRGLYARRASPTERSDHGPMHL